VVVHPAGELRFADGDVPFELSGFWSSVVVGLGSGAGVVSASGVPASWSRSSSVPSPQVESDTAASNAKASAWWRRVGRNRPVKGLVMVVISGMVQRAV
jgi:hypothetical protein